MNKSNFSTSAFLPVLLTVACFLVAWYMVLPNYYESKGELDVLETEILASRAKYNSLEETKTDLLSISDVLNLIYVSVSNDADEPNLITELEAIAIKHELIIPTINISDPTASLGEEYYYDDSESTYGVVQVSFSVAGDFARLNEFIGSLEKSIKFMNIQSLSYTSSSDENIIYLNIQLETYKY